MHRDDVSRVSGTFTFRFEEEQPNEPPSEKSTRLTKSNARTQHALTRPGANAQQIPGRPPLNATADSRPRPRSSKTSTLQTGPHRSQGCAPCVNVITSPF